MKHPSTRSLFDYWTQVRGERHAPERAEIDPAGIRHALPDVFMLNADFVDQIRFRMAGTRVCALFGRELRGELLTSLWSVDNAEALNALIAPVLAGNGTATIELSGHTARDEQVDLEFVVLPIAHTGHARIRAIGALAPMADPYWLGERPLVSMSFRAGRDPVTGSPQKPRLVTSGPLSPLEDVRVRHGFVVYSGGRNPNNSEKAG